MSARPMTAMAPAALPERIGKYLVEGVLGEGAMGIVYKALDPQIRRPVAIKTIRRALLAQGAEDLAAEARFRNEAEAAGRLAHPNIVSVHEFGGGGADDLYLVMEYVNGTPLSRLLGRGNRLPLPDAMSLMLQLLDALRAAHEQGVCHRDIKPANLLITPDGRLKITDFGIARIDNAALTVAASTLGSPGYMAPERYRSAELDTHDAHDARVDIFSCGVLLYELLTGMAPFKGAVDMVMYQVLNVDPPAPSSLPVPCRPPARYDPVVARALAKRAADRFPDAQAMIDALVDATPGAIPPLVSTPTLAMALLPAGVGVGVGFATGEPAAAPRSSLGRVPGVPASDTGGRPAVASTWPPRPARRADDRRDATAEHRPSASPAESAADACRPRWDAVTLERVSSILMRHLGPVAPVVVQQAARQCADLASLVRHVAYGTLAPAERRAFVADLRRSGRLAPSRPQAAAPEGEASPATAPVLGDTPLAEATVERATRVLTGHIGPIAPIVVARAAAMASSCEAFFVALADRVGDQVDRKQLLAQLWRAP